MTNKRIAHYLQETASLIDLSGGNPFRARAFGSAARTVERLEEPVADLLRAGSLTEVPGIGTGLAAQIEELLERGSFALRDQLLASLPPGLFDVLRIKGLGAKKVRRLWQELGVTSLAALEEAGLTGRLASLDGFGEKTQENILANLQLLKRYRMRRRYAEAYELALPVRARLRATPGIYRAELAGELRRKCETVEAAVLAVAATDATAVHQALAPWLSEAPEEEAGATLFSGLVADDCALFVYLFSPGDFATRWWRLTGSEEHCAAFEARYGPPAHASDERDVYARVGLPFIEPALREGAGELEAAAQNRLPSLITVDDLRGSLHNHSTYSDGAHSLREMAEAARRRGLFYFGICDHSRSLPIAHGLSIERVREQQAEITRLNEAFAAEGDPPFRILSGIESDVLEDGSLDYPDDVLDSFDFVVASVHTRLSMSEAEATKRVITAVENPYTTILGHATGRLLLAREGYPLDHERVIAACAAHAVAIELNANPYRLDMDWRWLRKATQQGVLIAINPDAHATDQLDHVRWGVAVARKGWLTAAQCLNALSLEAFTRWLDQRRAVRMP